MLPPNQPERRKGGATEALARSDQLARWLRITGLALAVYVAFIVTAASVIGVINSIQSVGQARRATTFARQAKEQAKLNEGVAKDIKLLVERQAPCVEGAPLDSPACVTKARTDKIVNDAIARMTEAIDSHDKTAHGAHDALMSAIRRRPTATPRTTITAAPRITQTTALAPTTAAPALARMTPNTTAAPRPVSAPPTTCPKRGNSDKCR